MKKIMIIDDDGNTRRSIRYVLKSHGYQVVEAESGPIGLNRMRQEPVDLVILDLIMPQMDGTEVCDRIKADPLLGHTPVIIFTVMRGEVCRDWKQYVNAEACLVKPFQVGELLTKVHELTSRAAPAADEMAPKIV